MPFKGLFRRARTKASPRPVRKAHLSVELLETREVLTASPYIVPVNPGVSFQSIITTGDTVGAYQMAGTPDGLGAFDNGDGTITVLMNHEFNATQGVAHTHNAALGAAGHGSYVDKLIVNKSDLSVVSGGDLIQRLVDAGTGNAITGTALNIDRLCSADLAAASAFYNALSGKGTLERLFLNGEETNNGRALATVVTGPNAGTTYVLPAFNKYGGGSWENLVANPGTGDTTLVIGDSDNGTGNHFNKVIVYVGTKQATGNEVEKAGLTNGLLYQIQAAVNGVNVTAESRTNALGTSGPVYSGTFTLTSGVGTTFSRPEDGAWDPNHPNDYYFVTTDQLDTVLDGVGSQVGRSRLWKLHFTDLSNPVAGGTIEAVLDGTEGQVMLDNLTIDSQGRVVMQEDVGNAAHNGKVWLYDIATDAITMLAKHDPSRFGDVGMNATAPFTQDEESSGVVDVSSIFGPGHYLLDVQAHYPNGSTLVEGGQLLMMTLPSAPTAVADSYDTVYQTTINVAAGQGVLSNDSGGALNVVSHTDPAHGTLTLNGDGSFTYTPEAGFIGQDSFSYTTAAVQLYKTNLPPLGTFGGVSIGAGAFGSAVVAVPGTTDEVYGLTDRGPNVDGPNGVKIEPIPSFVPAIGRFKLINGQAVLQQLITLKAADSTAYNGRVNTEASTGETIVDLDGNVLAADPNGYDPEGLVALADGTFWVSDEYGPYITHFDATGKQIGRLSPYDGSLPAELAKRVVNRGMEGLTITPDGSTLVGVMQSALQQTDLAGFDAKKLSPIRIVTYKIATGETHEYLYLLDNPGTTKTAVSEITAISNTSFILNERDGLYPLAAGSAGQAYKKFWKIDLAGATDVGPNSPLIGTSPGGTAITYNAANGGLLIGGKTIEKLVRDGTDSGQTTSGAAATLIARNIKPVQKSLYLDVTTLLTSLDPQAKFFSHDKLEGVSLFAGGTKLVISNDSDFGIIGVSNSTPPYQLTAKTSPTTGEQDNGEYLVIDLTHLTAPTSKTTVTIDVAKATPTVTVVDAGGIYNGSPFPVTNATVTGVAADGVIAVFGDPSLTYTYYQNGQALPGAPTNVGAYTVIAHYAGNDFYNAADSGAVAFTIAYDTRLTFNNTRPVHSGSTLPIKLQVTDANGDNLSSASLPVKAVSLIGPDGQQLTPDDAGKSNPNGLFRYDSASKGYIFNLKTSGLKSGRYTFVFTVGDDPTLHTLTFDVAD